MTKQPDQGWREHVLGMLPKMEASAALTGFQPATPNDFGPINFRGNRTPSDPADLLQAMALVKWTAIKQRADDLFAQVPTHDQVQELRNEATGYKNRIDQLVGHRSTGGLAGPSAAPPQVISEMRKLERAEKELARLTELKEVRTARWNSAGALARNVSDWLLHGGVPHGCIIESVDDPPISELLVKADGGRLDAAVERYRHRRREHLASLHRLRSAPWPSKDAKVAAKEFIDRTASAGAPNLDNAIEFGQPISLAKRRLRSMVRNVEAPGHHPCRNPGCVGLLFWLFPDEIFKKISAGIDEIADDKSALNQAQREEAEAQINADMLSVERAECSASGPLKLGITKLLISEMTRRRCVQSVSRSKPCRTRTCRHPRRRLATPSSA